MGVWLLRNYKQINFNPGSLSKIFRKAIEYIGIDVKNPKFRCGYSIGNEGSENKILDISAIGNIARIEKQPYEITFGFNYPDYEHEIITIRAESKDTLLISVYSKSSEKASNVLDLFEHELGLKSEPKVEPRNIDGEVDKILSRIDKIEKQIHLSHKLTCFISYRFDKRAKPYVQELARFLELLNVNVVTGAAFEPRRMSDKVQDKLSGNIDILIYLITISGESSWTRDEMALSYGKGAYIADILLG